MYVNITVRRWAVGRAEQHTVFICRMLSTLSDVRSSYSWTQRPSCGGSSCILIRPIRKTFNLSYKPTLVGVIVAEWAAFSSSSDVTKGVRRESGDIRTRGDISRDTDVCSEHRSCEDTEWKWDIHSAVGSEVKAKQGNKSPWATSGWRCGGVCYKGGGSKVHLCCQRGRSCRM